MMDLIVFCVDRIANRGYGGVSGGTGYSNRPAERDRYNMMNRYDNRYPDDRVYYYDRNQGFRGGYEQNRDFRPWDQSYRYVLLSNPLSFIL